MKTIKTPSKRQMYHGSYQSGMTLVELLVALAVFAVVMIAVGAFESNIFIYQSSVSGSLQTSQNAQVILKTMLQEIREAAPGSNGAYPLDKVGSTTIAFYSDVDNDGSTEKIGYSLIGTVMYRTIIKASGSPLSYNIASQSTSTIMTGVINGSTLPVFEYFDAYYTGTSTPLTYPVSTTAVRLVRINERLDLDPNRSPIPTIFTVQASLRNLKDNL